MTRLAHSRPAVGQVLLAGLLGTYLLANAVDIAATARAVELYGIAVEQNPLPRWLMATIGFELTAGAKMGVALLHVALIGGVYRYGFRRLAVAAGAVVVGLQGGVAAVMGWWYLV